MTLHFTQTQIRAGVWHGVLVGGGARPDIAVRHLDQVLPDVIVDPSDLGWNVQVPIPAGSIADGVQTFVVEDKKSGQALGDFTLIAGEVLGEDLRAEMALMRMELDMLKRVVRKQNATPGP
ncbi:MAG: hypothetical protein AB8B71_11700 [Paracoccaceae bacterium]